MISEWKRVVYAHECDDGYGETLICPHCGIDYAECPCPGPHQDDIYVYAEDDGGVLWACLRPHGTHDVTQEWLDVQLDLFSDSPHPAAQSDEGNAVWTSK